ncbi:MAG: DUF3887 domain-containing protein, partial [Candidatus Hydrogenedentales bacterium]
ASKLETMWTELIAKHGDYVKVAEMTSSPSEEMDTVRLVLEFEEGKANLLFGFQQGKIVDFGHIELGDLRIGTS